MQLAHVAIWTRDLERLRDFYQRYFGATTGPRYDSARRPFQSYFLTFESGAALELMTLEDLPERTSPPESAGFAHMAFRAGSRENVDAFTARLAADGHPVLSSPRQTGDGFYESVIADPDGNWVEITA